MQTHKLVVKLYSDGADGLPVDAVVPVFHHWIQEQGLPEHLLIDVADYAHVPEGPGTVLVSHEANIHLDREGGKPGMLYVRKQPIAGADTFRERLAAVFRFAFQAAAKLEADPALGGIRFRANDLAFRLNDRLLAPNTEATYAAVRDDLQAFLAELYKTNVALDHKHDAERLFEVRVKATATVRVIDLLSRLESMAPATAR
jgi:hypothetical protein